MTNNSNNLTRRSFLTASAATAALVASGNYAHAQGSDSIRVGLIGAGGRGTDAAVNVCALSKGVEISAIGDLFADHIDSKKNALRDALMGKGQAESYKVTDDRCFSGFDAYKKVLASDVNYIILATPPGYRPLH